MTNHKATSKGNDSTTTTTNEREAYPPHPPLALDYRQAYHRISPHRAMLLSVLTLAQTFDHTELRAFIELIGALAFEPDADVRAALAAEAINAALDNTEIEHEGLLQLFISQPAQL